MKKDLNPSLTPAQYERMMMLMIDITYVLKYAAKVADNGYKATDDDGELLVTKMQHSINDFLTMRSVMIDEGDIKQSYPKFGEIWRERIKGTRFQQG